MRNFFVLLTFAVLIVSQPVLASEITVEKKALIDKILEQTGQSTIVVGKQFSNAFIQPMAKVLENSNPNIDPKAFEILEEEVKQVVHEEMVINKTFSEILYPIYAKHFTEEDLKKMVEINDTPFGKKMIRVMPMITQEGMQAGQKFGQNLVPKIQQRLLDRFEAEGIKVK